MSVSADPNAPLAGIRVVDFGHYIAGPLAGMLLADQGASVVKVLRPDCDTSREPVARMLSRGKHEVQLDLKCENDLQVARRLVVNSADVVIENFRPGVMKRLGLGPKDMTAENPSLIYLSLPGFSSTDSAKSSIRAFEGVLGAATGLYTDINILRSVFGVSPVYSALPLPSVYGAVHGALAVTMALLTREKTGRGTTIEVPLAAAAMSAMGGVLFRIQNQPTRYDVPPMPKALKNVVLPAVRFLLARSSDAFQQRVLARMAKLLPPLADSHLCGDGNWLYLVATEHDRHSALLLEEMGIRLNLLAAGMIERNPYEVGTLKNNLLDTGGLSKKWKTRIREELAACFATQPADYWEENLGRAGIACAVQRTTAEWLQSPEAKEAGLTVDVDDPELGVLRQPGILLSLGKSPVDQWQPRPAQSIDGDLEAVVESLERLGAFNERSQQAASPSEEATLPECILDGVRVLDLSTVVAGPSCGRTLAEYGADVIKIDPPAPHAGPRFTCWFAVEVGQGKRSILLDLKQEEGRNVFWKLLDSADVVLHNFRPGVAEHLGIDYASIKQRRPEVVYCHISAYMGPKPGPWSGRRGYDPVLQAATGIMRRYGGDAKPELHGLASCVDYLSGFSAAYGIALALLKRQRSGGAEGDQVTTSLAQAAQWIQAPFMVTSDKHQPGSEPAGQSARGEHALYRIYRARDGWVFLAGLRTDVALLTKIPVLAKIPNDSEEECCAFLTKQLRKRNVSYWIETLQNAGFGCHKVETLAEIREANRIGANSATDEQEMPSGRTIAVIGTQHPAGSLVETVAPVYARFSNTLLRLGTPAPKPGSDTRDVLREYGYADEQIAELLSEGVVSDQFHEEYLPP